MNPSSNEPTPEQFSRISELEKEIKKLENSVKKSHDLEKNEINTLESNSLTAYCVKCKTKRIIKNPEETTMKNGRPAIRGICSICTSKVFRIVKMKK